MSFPSLRGVKALAKTLTLNFKELESLPPEVHAALTRLDLVGNRLKMLPESIGALTRLTRLDLGGNQLTCLPEGIGNLRALTSLDLGGNRLTQLPSEMGALKALYQLNLAGNLLESLPDEFCSLSSLAWLDLRGNRLRSLPNGIGALKALIEVQLRGNHLRVLPDGICTLENLTWLDVRENRLTALPERIAGLTALTDLSLGGNRFTPPPVLALLRTAGVRVNMVSDLARIDKFRFIVEEKSIQKNPVQVLQDFVEVLHDDPEGKMLLKIEFTDSRAIDRGGVGRQFLNDLFQSLVKTDLFFEEDGFYRPRPSACPFLENIGAVFMYCYYVQLSTKESYPIGVFFQEKFFENILSFTDEELKEPLEEIPFDRCLELADFPFKEGWKEGDYNVFAEDIRGFVAPLHAIGRGMRCSPFASALGFARADVQSMGRLIQGTIEREYLMSRLHFTHSRSAFLLNWLKEAGKDELKKFVKSMTGSSALPQGSKKLIITESYGEPFFHTCAWQLDFPFDQFRNQATFNEYFSVLVDMGMHFNAF